MVRKIAVAGLVALSTLGFAYGAAQADDAPGGTKEGKVLKFGGLPPAQSPWAQILNVWAKAVGERTKGAVTVRFYWNGTQGDEASMVGKIKAGQLDGAGLTSVGLSKIHKPYLALQMPGVFATWAHLDKARDGLKDELKSAAEGKGFTILGSGDMGRMHMFSKGFAVTGPESLRGQKPYVWRDDDIHRALYQAIGGVTAVPLGVPEVLPNLNTGIVNAIDTASLTCEQLQWSSRLDHILMDTTAYMIGALVMSQSKLNSLSADEKAAILDSGQIAAKALTVRIRAEDDTAQKRLSGKMTPHSLSPAEKAEWNKVFQTVRQRLGQQGVFPPELISKIEKLGS